MEFLSDLWHAFKDLINPEVIIKNAGDIALVVLFLIVFAETGLMFGFFLPGDSLLFTAGLFVATGILDTNIGLLVGVLIVAAIVGDQTGYIIGRKMGKRLLTMKDGRIFKKKYILQTQAFYERHGGKTIIIGRFVPIVRTFAPMVAGVVGLEYRKFVSYNVIGGILWVGLMTLLGYALGKTFPQLGKYIEYVVIVIILISVFPIITTYFKERKLSKEQKEAGGQ